MDLGEVGVDEEIDACALQRTAGLAGCLDEVRWVRVSEELRYNGGLGDDGTVVTYGGHEAARVDGEVFGRAGDGEVDCIC